MANDLSSSLLYLLKKNALTALLFVAALGLSAIHRQPISVYPSLVDWNTIVTLSGLLLITTGIKESGLFSFLAYRISRRINNERLLALFLVSLAAVLSMFLTNDIALFIVVPLTLNLQSIVDDDYSKIIIFEAIAVNVGSSLTPIGNPQNIFLWHQWAISFPVFVSEMAPLVFVMAICLLIMVLVSFSSKRIKVKNHKDRSVDKGLFILSFILLISFIVAIELGYGSYFLCIVFMAMLLMYKEVILKPDWGLVLLFILLFIDLNLISELKIARHLLSMLDFSNESTVFLSGAFFSQAISNVPTAIILANHSHNIKMIAYGVNVGGNGFFIASFANLIALRFINKAYSYLYFHCYSILFFIISLLFSYCYLKFSFKL